MAAAAPTAPATRMPLDRRSRVAAQDMARAAGYISTILSAGPRGASAPVRDAYRSLLEMEAADLAVADAPPARHAAWLDTLAQHHGIHVCARRDLAARLTQAEWQGAFEDLPESAAEVSAFDPIRHILVFTDGSAVFAHLAEEDLGPGARVVAPHRKCAVAWWE